MYIELITLGDPAVLSRRSAAALAVLAALGEPARADSGAAPAQPPPVTKPEAAAVEPVAKDQVVAIMGQAVAGPNGKEIGRLIDVLVDSAGVPRAAVIDIGGFMGVGSRSIAVEWNALRFEPWSDKAPITLMMSLDAIRAMPEFKGLPQNRAAPVVVPAPQPAEPAAHS